MVCARIDDGHTKAANNLSTVSRPSLSRRRRPCLTVETLRGTLGQVARLNQIHDAAEPVRVVGPTGDDLAADVRLAGPLDLVLASAVGSAAILARAAITIRAALGPAVGLAYAPEQHEAEIVSRGSEIGAG